jgi:potassium-transporting ATPase potassium-binding subunit
MRGAARAQGGRPKAGGGAITLSGWVQIGIVLVLVVGFAHRFGRFIAELFEGRRTFLSPVLAPVERGFYRLAGVDPAVEQGWLA